MSGLACQLAGLAIAIQPMPGDGGGMVMPLQAEHELHRRRSGRNIGLALVLAAFVALVFGLSIAKIRQGDLMQAFYKRLTGTDQIAQMHAAKAWSTWEGRTATLRPNTQVVERFSEAHRALSIARIECHYFVNQAFLEPDQLLRDMPKIAHLPGVIVHGRYDVICPLDNAWALHQAWPNSELQIIRDAGHSAAEPGITDALIRAAEQMARRLLDLPPADAE